MYKHWKDRFYPQDLISKDWLSFYSKNFSTVEINNSFYKLPKKSTFHKWKKETPKDFVFSVKANRYITHMKKLNEPKEALNNMFKAVEGLGKKCGPILFQLPPNWNINIVRFGKFLSLLPKDYVFAFEFRNASWYVDGLYKLLRKYKASLCIHDHKDAPSPEVVTSNVIYIRFHGPNGFYSSKYSDNDMENWVKKIKNWSKERSVYVYFNNDIDGFAIENAKQLRELL